jgi:predicted GH43/DUF377 family glycosyl hydrolase
VSQAIPSETVEQFQLTRLGIVMNPDPERPTEAWGVLNPASGRLRADELYLFPRMVAEGNYSRIGIARVCFDPAGTPRGVERLGFALEPQAAYEHAKRGYGGGVEDPRISYIPLLGCFVMAYTALGPLGPRIALAISKDLFTWKRLGLLRYEPSCWVDFNRYGNKDCVLFPLPVTDREGQPSFALLHRPTYLVHNHDGTVERVLPDGITDARPSIWISYTSVERARADIHNLVRVHDCELLAVPQEPWEQLKIGAGTPPVLTEAGWVLYYHGVSGTEPTTLTQHKDVCYRAGVMLLDRDDPRQILYRSRQPVLQPAEPAERDGIVPNVVFPTAVDVRGQRLDVYYGAADTRIGVATTFLTTRVLLAPSAASSAE